MSFRGIPIVQSVYAVARHEDWSQVRSPARARRRLRRGFPQNIVVTMRPAMMELGGVLHVHPTIYRALVTEHGAAREFLGAS